MRRMFVALCLTVPILSFTVVAGPEARADKPGLDAWAGDYGDAEGRLRCAEDGEFLRFEPDGRVLLFGDGPDGQEIGALSETPDGGLSMRVQDGGAAIDFALTPAGNGALAIVGASVDGTADPTTLDAWQSRHGAWVPCPQ